MANEKVNKVLLGNEVLIDLTEDTVSANNLLAGATAHDASGSAISGSMPNQGTKTASLNAGQSYTIPQGYHSGSGVVTANSLASQTIGTATANDIASGLTAWVNGTKLTGTATSGGATITVTYTSTFYNKTMTCSNGTKTYTKTTTSSGSTEFKVSDEGTWTITCNGVSRTVNVVLNYSTVMMITKTVTVYGAAGATISFTDAVGSKTVTLNNSGQGSVSISFIPPSRTITFTDTNKAKNPNNLSQNYSKSITITESTTSIKVMPDGALYWWGWEYSDCYEENHHYGQAGGGITVSHGTNGIQITGSGTGNAYYCYNLEYNRKIPAGKTIHTVASFSNPTETKHGGRATYPENTEPWLLNPPYYNFGSFTDEFTLVADGYPSFFMNTGGNNSGTISALFWY